ncbi:tudor domain-containing 6-like [Diorhabda carinulata]|uniref:tudor domain-containing 6-like n=1 Tax=Diorhabda carinulata TaxID=1163345 RepID=UPI0025A27504|nr:tudor domain-containing 6-like [Diorhabda carinulata]
MDSAITIGGYIVPNEVNSEFYSTTPATMEQDSEINRICKEISYSTETIKPNDIYSVLIDNVYDPSKFWLILHVKERQLFEQYITNYYKEKKILMTENHIKMYATCIVCIDSVYYRAIVLPTLLQNKAKLRVFLIDYGQCVNIALDNIFYIFKKHRTVPRFAIRGALADVVPINRHEPWTRADLYEFSLLISEKRLLAKIIEIDSQEKVLHIALFSVNESAVVSINEKLIENGIATHGTWIYNSNYKISKYRRKIKYMHLIPTFHAIETGMVPSSLWEQSLIKEVPLDLLQRPYYEYQNINCSIFDS